MEKQIKQRKKYVKSNKDEILKMVEILDKSYGDAKCGLDYTTPLSLVIALILAAQCTDKRVNVICPILLKKYPNANDLANADLKQIEEIIHSCGFYKNKAKNIKECCKLIAHKFNNKVPDTMEELVTLPGIGRKSANIILQECFGITKGIAVDTHVTRITRKMGFSNENSAQKIEKDLMKKLPKKYWNKINHILVNHGRAICIARKPNCNNCPIANLCKKND